MEVSYNEALVYAWAAEGHLKWDGKNGGLGGPDADEYDKMKWKKNQFGDGKVV